MLKVDLRFFLGKELLSKANIKVGGFNGDGFVDRLAGGFNNGGFTELSGTVPLSIFCF